MALAARLGALIDLGDLTAAPAARGAVEGLTLPAMADRLLGFYRRLRRSGRRAGIIRAFRFSLAGAVVRPFHPAPLPSPFYMSASSRTGQPPALCPPVL